MTTTAPPTAYRLVVGVDLNETGDHALREALRLATARRDGAAAVDAAYVVPAAPAGGHTAAAIRAEADALEAAPPRLRAHVDAVVRELRFAAAVPLTLHVVVGDPADALHQLAVDLDADAIVVGTHARRGLARMLLGSVAIALVERAHCPVIVARPKQFEDLPRTPAPDPVRPEDAAVRAATGGAQLFSEENRHRLRTHVYGYRETFTVGGHTPGLLGVG